MARPPTATDPDPVLPGPVDLRTRRRIRTKTLLQTQALALFAATGYQGTSVEDIALAADISPRTFYRYFACKEDVVLWDELDEVAFSTLWSIPPTGQPLVTIVRLFRDLTAGLYRRDPDRMLARVKLTFAVPDIRARFVNYHLSTVGQHLAELSGALGVPDGDLGFMVSMAAGLSTMLVAVDHWQRHDGHRDLIEVFDEAIAALADLPTGTLRPPAP